MNFYLEDPHAATAGICLYHLKTQNPGWIYKAQELQKAGDWALLCVNDDLLYHIGVMLIKDTPKRVFRLIYSPHILTDDKLKGPIKPEDHIYFSSRFQIDDDKVVWTDSKVRTYFTCKELLHNVLDLWDANNFIVLSIARDGIKKELVKHQDDGTDLIYDEYGTKIILETVDASQSIYRFGLKTGHQRYYRMTFEFTIVWRNEDDD